jgi:hypothetical protein
MFLSMRRFRYVFAAVVGLAASFFKSGSLYSCKAEEGFRCGRYMGNGRNFMNSVVTVETPAGPTPDSVYIVSMISNVLRFNSAWDHSRFGAAIQEMVRTREVVSVREDASAQEMQEVTKSD